MTDDRYFELLHRLDAGPVEPDPNVRDALWERLEAALTLEVPTDPEETLNQAVIDMRSSWDRASRRRPWRRRVLVLAAVGVAAIALAVVLTTGGDQTHVQPANDLRTEEPPPSPPSFEATTPEQERALAVVEDLNCTNHRVPDEDAILRCSADASIVVVHIADDPHLAELVRYFVYGWSPERGVIAGDGWVVTVVDETQTEAIRAVIGGQIIEYEDESDDNAAGPPADDALPIVERPPTPIADDAAELRLYGEADGLFGGDVGEIDVNADGTTWVGDRAINGAEPSRLDGLRWTGFPLEEDFSLHALAAGPAGTAWAIGDRVGGDDGTLIGVLAHFDGTEWSYLPHRELFLNPTDFFAVDSDGVLWANGLSVDPLNPTGTGLVRIDLDRYDRIDSPTGGFVCEDASGSWSEGCKYELDPNGGVWALSNRGSARLDDTGWTEFAFEPGVTIPEPDRWLVADDGTSWVVEFTPDPRWVRLDSRDGTTFATVYPIDVTGVAVDSQCANDRGLSDEEAELLDSVELRTGYLHAVWIASDAGPDGSVWSAIACVGLSRLDPDDGSETIYGPAQLGDVNFRGLATAPDGSVWFTREGGVVSLTPRP